MLQSGIPRPTEEWRSLLRANFELLDQYLRQWGILAVSFRRFQTEIKVSSLAYAFPPKPSLSPLSKHFACMHDFLYPMVGRLARRDDITRPSRDDNKPECPYPVLRSTKRCVVFFGEIFLQCKKCVTLANLDANLDEKINSGVSSKASIFWCVFFGYAFSSAFFLDLEVCFLWWFLKYSRFSVIEKPGWKTPQN